MKKLLVAGTLAAVAGVAQAFCGFYVGKADANLFNEASQVIVVRDGDKTVVSMLNDYKGELKEFAIVVPVPAVLQKGQINVGEKGHLIVLTPTPHPAWQNITTPIPAIAACTK